MIPYPMLAARAVAALAAACALAAAAPAWAECKLQQVLQLPVTMVGAQPTAPVKINGADARFLLDSGAFYSMISPAALIRFGLKGTAEPRLQVRGIGGGAQTQSTIVEDFGLGGSPYRHIQFLVADGADVGDLDGLLGQNVLGAADVEYDLANGLVRIFKPQDCGSGVLAYWSGGPMRTLDMLSDTPTLNHAIRAIGLLNGQPIRLTFDTGASRSLLTRAAAARAGVTPSTPGAVFAGHSKGIGHDQSDAWSAPFDTVALGGELIEHSRITFGDASMGDTDMLIGADFFLSHRVYVANSQHKIYFTYNGGPIFQSDGPVPVLVPAPGEGWQAQIPEAGAAPAPADINTPTDAAGFERRGAAFMSRRDYAHAIDDFTRAAALTPADPKPFYDRGVARWASGQLGPAMADFNQVLILKPDDAPALVAQGALHATAGDRSRAYRDFLAAEGVAGDDAHTGLVVADAYYRLGAFDDALRQFDRWIAANPRADQGAALLGRCRTRVMLKGDLDKALADCSQALALYPGDTEILSARGLVYFRRGDFDAAIGDFNAVARLQPKSALALYIRGLSEQKAGRGEAGQTDIKAALALTPTVADQGRRLGFWP